MTCGPGDLLFTPAGWITLQEVTSEDVIGLQLSVILPTDKPVYKYFQMAPVAAEALKLLSSMSEEALKLLRCHLCTGSTSQALRSAKRWK